MKTENSNIRYQTSISSVGSAFRESSALPDSMASIIRDCTVIEGPVALKSHKIEIVQNTLFSREGFRSRYRSKVTG
jgi:hypothetical protein